MPALSAIAKEKLRAIAGTGRLRILKDTERRENAIVMRQGKQLVSFSCNDYLGLSQYKSVKALATEATEKYGAGAGASRLVTGNHPLYKGLETKLALWKGAEAALIFGSGYLANIGVIPAVVGKGDCIVADRLVHACLLDGANLSGAKLLRFKHNDMEDCKRLLAAARGDYRYCLILTEEIFSMDGDIAPLQNLATLAAAYDAWLMVDGAHSLTPPTIPVDIYIGTLSKALGSYGGYVVASLEFIDYLATSARSLLFSTGLPPSTVAAASAALDILMANPNLAETSLEKARLFTYKTGLPNAQSSIVPLILKEELKVINAGIKLEDAGFLVTAIRPPTVPAGTSRLRFAFSALHRDEDIIRLADIIRREGWV